MEVLGDSSVDVGLLQESPLPPDSWESEHYDRGASVIGLSNRVALTEFRNIPQGRRPTRDEIAVSAPGTIAAANVVPETGKPFVAVSIYARWEKPHPSTPTNWGVGYADAMAHRAISDLSAFIGHVAPSTHRILVAGDFNLIHGATDSNRFALPARDRSVFSRLKGSRVRVRRSAIPPWPGSQSDSSRPSHRQPQPADLPHDAPESGDCREPARLRLRLARIPPKRAGLCLERSRGVGSERPLPDSDRGRRGTVMVGEKGPHQSSVAPTTVCPLLAAYLTGHA